MSASNENPGNPSLMRLSYNQGEESTKVTTLKSDKRPEVYLRVRATSVRKKERIGKKRKKEASIFKQKEVKKKKVQKTLFVISFINI